MSSVADPPLDTSSGIRVARDWVKSIALAAICLGLIGASLYGMRMQADSYHEHRFQSGSFILFPLLMLFTPFVFYRLILPWGAPVRIGPEGIADLRAGSGTIPWDQISNVVSRGEFVILTLRRGFTKTYPMSLTQRVLKATRRSAGPNHLLIADWCLATTKSELFNTICAYRAANSPRRP